MGKITGEATYTSPSSSSELQQPGSPQLPPPAVVVAGSAHVGSMPGASSSSSSPRTAPSAAAQTSTSAEGDRAAASSSNNSNEEEEEDGDGGGSGAITSALRATLSHHLPDSLPLLRIGSALSSVQMETEVAEATASVREEVLLYAAMASHGGATADVLEGILEDLCDVTGGGSADVGAPSPAAAAGAAASTPTGSDAAAVASAGSIGGEQQQQSPARDAPQDHVPPPPHQVEVGAAADEFGIPLPVDLIRRTRAAAGVLRQLHDVAGELSEAPTSAPWRKRWAAEALWEEEGVCALQTALRAAEAEAAAADRGPSLIATTTAAGEVADIRGTLLTTAASTAEPPQPSHDAAAASSLHQPFNKRQLRLQSLSLSLASLPPVPPSALLPGSEAKGDVTSLVSAITEFASAAAAASAGGAGGGAAAAAAAAAQRVLLNAAAGGGAHVKSQQQQQQQSSASSGPEGLIGTPGDGLDVSTRLYLLSRGRMLASMGEIPTKEIDVKMLSRLRPGVTASESVMSLLGAIADADPGSYAATPVSVSTTADAAALDPGTLADAAVGAAKQLGGDGAKLKLGGVAELGGAAGPTLNYPFAERAAHLAAGAEGLCNAFEVFTSVKEGVPIIGGGGSRKGGGGSKRRRLQLWPNLPQKRVKVNTATRPDHSANSGSGSGSDHGSEASAGVTSEPGKAAPGDTTTSSTTAGTSDTTGASAGGKGHRHTIRASIAAGTSADDGSDGDSSGSDDEEEDEEGGMGEQELAAHLSRAAEALRLYRAAIHALIRDMRNAKLL